MTPDAAEVTIKDMKTYEIRFSSGKSVPGFPTEEAARQYVTAQYSTPLTFIANNDFTDSNNAPRVACRQGARHRATIYGFEVERTVTNASADYDYPGTREIEVLGKDKHGRTYRVVETQAGSRSIQQRDRYESGLRIAKTVEDWAKISHLHLVTA